jgi:tetratricopeptide (TPR) repeat protein
LYESKKKEKKYTAQLLTGETTELKDKPLHEEAEIALVRQKQILKTLHPPTMKDVPARYEGSPRTFVVPKKGDASPHRMKQQDDAFYKNGNYKSAINAYTEAIEGSDRKFLAVFSNMAARLKCELYKLALNDCDEALKLIPEPILTAEVW